MKAAGAITLIALACACSNLPRKHSSGYRLDFAISPEPCGDGSYIVVTTVGNRRFTINQEGPFGKSELAARLKEILTYRAEKVVFVKADAGVQYGDFVDLVDGVRGPDIVVSLLTSKVAARSHQTRCLEVSCNRDCFAGERRNR